MTIGKHIISAFAGAMIAAGGVAVGLAGAASATSVEVEFTGYVGDNMARITRADKKREAIFRKYRKEDAYKPIAHSTTLDRTEWAGERIFPDFDDYTVPGLIQNMMERGIREADPGFSGKVVVTVEELRISGFPVSVIKGSKTRMTGTVAVYDAAGNLTAEHDIWAGVTPEFTVAQVYTGHDYVYSKAALHSRVGPIAAEFTEKALETLYPGYDAPGLVLKR